MLKIEGVAKKFDTREVLRHVDLEVDAGQIVALMGSSGGGKTTLLRCVSGLIAPTRGRVLLGGIDVQSDAEAARKQMGMVFQSAALFDFMNVTDNVVFGLERQLQLSREDRKSVAATALERVGLSRQDLRKMPGDLSGGMRKRVGIARALALSPQIMLYDEPTTGLDPITTYHIDHLMMDLTKETGVTALIVSHDVNSVMRVAHRVAFLHEGSLVFFGTAEEFLVASHPAIRELVDKARALSFD